MFVDEKDLYLNDVKVKLAKTSLRGRVTLNVGGYRYTTSIDTPTHEKDTFFTELFSGKWKIELDDIDKSLFIDRIGQILTYILEYLRTDTVTDDVINK